MHKLKKILLLLAPIIILNLGGEVMAMELKSSAFTYEGNIPSKYTCDGKGDYSPPLSWSNFPAGTKTFALIADDPDAPRGTWVHWVAWNIPSTVTSFKEGMDKNPKLADGTMQGINDSKSSGYGAPCPPSGTHRYIFKLYALDATLSLSAKTTKADLESAMKGHILAQSTLLGTYSRQK